MIKFLPLVVLIPFLLLAFSKDVRAKIFKRDKATCQGCGRKWDSEEMWMLHAAHYTHDKSNPDYNDPKSGRMLCVDCHQRDHEEAYDKATNEKDKNLHAYAIRKLKQADRHRWGYKKGKGS